MNFSPSLIQVFADKKIKLPNVVMEQSLAHDLDDLLRAQIGSAKICIVDDLDTEHAFGGQVYRALKNNFPCTHVTLPHRPIADAENATLIRNQSSQADVLIAVGGGTINDLCKYVVHQTNKPYITIPTCASMNGYLSANASITIDGYKHTQEGYLPSALWCDLSVVAKAPLRLAKSGLGDSLARPTAQADWLLSHRLLGTHYDVLPFEWIATLETELFDQARGVALADAATLKKLMELLLLSGLGMTYAGGSYPASQGEHMIAHAMGMLQKESSDNLHGEEIAVTSLLMAQLQTQLMQHKIKIISGAFPEAHITAHYGKKIAQEAKKAYTKKQERIEEAAPQNILESSDSWQAIVAEIQAIHTPARLQTIAEAAQLNTRIVGLGWEKAELEVAQNSAKFLRDRFTFLDMM